MTTNNDPDLDDIFDKYERLGLIYIARPRDLTLIKGCKFTQNIGTFGAGVTIDSPNWQTGSQPHVVLSKNTFEKNMAYFSGNAIYVRPTILATNLEEKQNCAGVNIIGNTFKNNIGMKVHNGGAISAYCY